MLGRDNSEWNDIVADLDGGNLHQRGVQHSASPLHWWTPNWYKYSDDLMSYIRCSASTSQHWRLSSEEFWVQHT